MGARRRREQIRERLTREQKTLPERVRQLEVVCDALLRCIGQKRATRAIAERIAEDSGRAPPPGLFARLWSKLRGEPEPEVIPAEPEEAAGAA